MTDKADRDALAALVAGGKIPGPRHYDRTDAIIAAVWKPPGATFDVCGHGRRPDESCILCERVAQ